MIRVSKILTLIGLIQLTINLYSQDASSTPLVKFETEAEWKAHLAENQWKYERAKQYDAKKMGLKSASVEKSIAIDGPETLNNDMRPSPEWMGLPVTDDHFFEWQQAIFDKTAGNPAIKANMLHDRETGGGDHPPPFGDYSQEESELLWRTYRDELAPKNAEAKEYQYQCKFALLVTPQAYSQLQEENPGVEDPAEWRDVYGFPVLEHMRRECDLTEQTVKKSGINLRVEMIPEFIIIDDPLVDEIDQPLPNGKLDEVNVRLRDEVFEAGLSDPTSKVYQQVAKIAADHGVSVGQLQTMVIARWGQSAGESYFTSSGDPKTGGRIRAFGLNMHSLGGYEFVSQQDGLVATELLKSMTSSGSTPSYGNMSGETFVADILTANGLDENWYPLKVEGQDESEAARLQFNKNCHSIVTCTSPWVSGAKLIALSNSDRTERIVFKNSQTGEEKVIEIATGSEFQDATNMNNWQQFLMMGTSREVGLVAQDMTVDITSADPSADGITVAETNAGHVFTIPSGAVLAEANSEISRFLVDPSALPDGVSVAQDGTGATITVSPEAMQVITDSGVAQLDFVVRGFSPDDKNLCTPSTTMRVNVETAKEPPEAHSESFDLKILSGEQAAVSIAGSILVNDINAVGVEFVGDLPEYTSQNGENLVFDNDKILDGSISRVVLEYYTLNKNGQRSENTATCEITFKNEDGFTVDVDYIETNINSLTIFPNPWDGETRLIIKTNRKDLSNDVKTILYDLKGNKRYESKLGDLNSIGLESGVYIIQLEIDNRELMTKLMIE